MSNAGTPAPDIRPFQIQVPPEKLNDLRDRLSMTRWPAQPSGTGWERGVPLDYLGFGLMVDGSHWANHQKELDRFRSPHDDCERPDIHSSMPPQPSPTLCRGRFMLAGTMVESTGSSAPSVIRCSTAAMPGMPSMWSCRRFPDWVFAAASGAGIVHRPSGRDRRRSHASPRLSAYAPAAAISAPASLGV